MRKHKSVVAILLAVMMIFTFMPTMAFAADDGTWDTETFSYFKYDGVTYNQLTKTQDENGVTKVVVNSSAYAYTLPKEVTNAEIYYLDLNGAKLGVNSRAFYAYYNPTGNDGFESIYKYGTASVSVKTSNGFANWMPASTDSWSGKLAGADSFDPESLSPQEFDLTLNQSFGPSYSIYAGTSADDPIIVGAPDSAHVIVNAKAPDAQSAEDARFFLNEVKEEGGVYAGALRADYNGAMQTVVMGGVTGYDVSYSIFDQKTGKYNGVLAVSVTDVADPIYVKAVVTNPTKAEDTYTFYFNVAVEGVARVQFDFVEDGDAGEYQYSLPEGTIYDPSNFVDSNAIRYRTGGTILNPRYHKVSPADIAAVEANKEELKSWFNTYYEVTQSSKKVDKEKKFTLQVKERDLSKLTDEERTALTEKYAQLIKNFKGLTVNDDRTATLYITDAPVIENTQDDDITFSGVTTKSFKAKKKTKKLASTKTFQVAAVADSGKAITFSGTSNNAKVKIDATGKVTVKKGLKKGAKVKLVVKAKTTAGNGYKACKETKTYTIKIK